MKKLVLFAMVCCAMVLTSCNKDQHTYYTTTNYELSSNDNVTSVKAILGTINLYWNGNYTFTGDNEDYTDVLAETKFLESRAAILLHGDELKPYMNDGGCFYYNLYSSDDNELLESVKFYVEDDTFTSEVVEDNVED